mgnify:CR=1 FL=1
MSDWRTAAGIARSCLIYWRPGRQAALTRWYRPMVPPGSLAFDIGAHLGDRSIAFARLGARVVAVEPQPALLPVLRRITAPVPAITVLPLAVGARPGTARLSVSRATPTVSSLSGDWVHAMQSRHPGFRRVRWDGEATVSVTTLDQLIAEHGVPAFCKIDVEGLEADVLVGLGQPLQAVSFEFIPGAIEVALACVQRLGQLAHYRYNVAIAEQRRFQLPAPVDAATLSAWLTAAGSGSRSGDVYAFRSDPPPGP